MPWRETCAMDERLRFVAACVSGEDTVTALCERFGISRKTGYKWLERYRREGVAGLAERSRRPRRLARAIGGEMAATIVDLRVRYPRWGPKKLRARLGLDWPEMVWPAASTIGDLLRRHGLVRPRRRRRGAVVEDRCLTAAAAPGVVWAADLKGWFRLGNGRRCEPLTVSDGASRYLLCCRHMERTTTAAAEPVFERLFKEHGLPRVMRVDNGPPFSAPHGLGGLSALSVWWLKLGIRPERIAPGRPDQNGRHERVHRTLREETADPPAANAAEQQRRFDVFRFEYNTIRPHEALGQVPPAQVYVPSPRLWPDRLREPAYDADAVVRKVAEHGTIRWRGEHVHVTRALAGEPVALIERETGDWTVRYFDIDLGVLERVTLHVRPQGVRRRPSYRRRSRRASAGDLMDSAAALPTTPQPQQQPPNA
jgi:putative transposase